MIELQDDLIILNGNGEKIPVFIEGDAPPELPNEFYTVSEDYTSNAVTADNKAVEVRYEFTLKWYTKDDKRLYSGLNEAIEQLISKGYDIDGVGYRNGSYQNAWFSRLVEVDKIDYMEE